MAIEKPIIYSEKQQVPAEAKIVETFESALVELFFVKHPSYKKGMPQAEKPLQEFLKSNRIKDIWVYYPWTNTAVHTVAEAVYYQLRTARNRHLINGQEQKNYRAAKVAIAGLSVGSSALAALTMSGGPRIIKIADFDTIEITNLNRIQANLLDVGSNKCQVAARRAWELDPFLDLQLFDRGINNDNLKNFILDNPKTEILVDAMDSIDMKIKARYICRKHGIPVLMATDNGDDVILDVERFDQKSNLKIFHGLIEEIEPAKLKDLNFSEFMKIALEIIGPEYHTPRMQESILELSKTISGVPQLGPTASMAGTIIAYAIRRISNQQDLPSGKYWVSLEEKLMPDYITPTSKQKRDEQTKNFIEKLTAKKQ